MTINRRPLTDRQERFVAAYAGDATAAAAAAGYGGSRPSLATIGSRLLADPRVQERLAARRNSPPTAREQPAAPSRATPPREPPERSSSDEDEDDALDLESAPVDVLRRLMNDPTVLGSTRGRCAEVLLKREDAANASDDPPVSFINKVNAIVAARRKRERQTCCCFACNQRLPGRR